MKRARYWRARLAGLLGRRNADIGAELESHIQLQTDDNIRAGMTPGEARREAILKLGGVEAVKESYRDQQTIPLLDNLRQDVRLSLRQLRKSPGFTFTAIAMLTLGIAASVAIFAFVDAAMLKPLPFRDPNRLALVYETIPTCPLCNVSYPDYLDYKKQNTTFDQLELYRRHGYSLTTPTGAERVRATRVTDGFFRVLGVQPARGRDFLPGEDLASAARTTLITWGTWQRRFGGNESIVGQTVSLNGNPYTIIGVLPREFHFPPGEPAEFWTAYQAESECDLRRSCHASFGIGRLKDGVSVEAARANIASVAANLEQVYPASNKGQGGTVQALTESIAGPVKPVLLTLLGGAALLLLIAAANAAGLVLVRAENRRREIAVRAALGASSLRLFGLFVTEAGLLVAAGAGAGLLAASWSMRVLTTLIPPDMLAVMSYLHDLSLNGRVLGFAGALAFLAVALLSLTPAFRLRSTDPREGLAEGSRGSSGNAWRRLGGKLVIVELATSMVLLVAAGLLGQSLNRLLHVNLGFQPDQLLTIDVTAPADPYDKPGQAIVLGRQVISEISSLPGVKAAGIAADGVPLDGNGNTTWLRIVGKPWNGEHNDTPQREVSANYFSTLGARLAKGRYFSDSEDTSHPPVAIVNESFAKAHFAGEDAVGRQVAFLSKDAKPITIVGVVENIREGSLDQAIPPVIYFPYNQNADRGFGLVVRSSQESASALIPQIQARLRQIHPEIVTSRATTMAARIDTSAYMHRSAAWLVGSFAALALLLGIVGLYGVIAYSVGQRTREIGVRMALGARPASVYRMIVREAGTLAAIGIAIGIAASLAGGSLIRGMLFDVRSWDVPTLVGVSLVLGGAAVLASFLPARRAAGVSPSEALRAE